MSESQFTIFAQGSKFVMSVTTAGLIFEGEASPNPRSWGEVSGMSFPNPFSAVIALSDAEALQVGFGSRAERDEFLTTARTYLAAVEGKVIRHQGPALRPVSHVSLVTVDQVPGRDIVAFRGLVTGHSVMSRNAMSDLGSELKSVLGGSLKGMEQAIGQALADARRQLEAAARAAEADAVVGVHVAIAGLGDKAEAVVMTGTAVSTAPRTDGAG